MKMTPVAAGSPRSVNMNEGQSASPDRLARAKAISAGESPPQETVQKSGDMQADRAQESIKRIKMRTQRSTDRHQRIEETPASVPVSDETAPVSDIPDSIEQTAAVTEASKPLSPQFAALAKQKREIQLERQKLDADKAALAASQTNDLSGYVSKADLKASPLKLLLAEGVTYDQLTEEILAQSSDNPNFSRLEADIKTLKEGFENQTKSMSEKEAAIEAQVRAQITRDAQTLISQGDDFEMIREAGYAPKITELIDKTFKKTGEIMDLAEAATLIENELLEESLKFARIKKVQSRLQPAPTPAQQQQPPKQDRPGTKTMRTLTNRDGSTSLSMSKRERAIAAMEGRLK